MLLFVFLWFSLYAAIPILKRIERTLLENRLPASRTASLIAFCHTLRRHLMRLPWEKKGTSSALLLLTVTAWLLEWMSIFLFAGSEVEAIKSVINRVGYSLSFQSAVNMAYYDFMMHTVYVMLLLMMLCNIIYIVVIRSKRMRRQ